MLKSTILIPFVLLSASGVWADSVEYTFTLNTSSIAGSTGSVDFTLYPGSGAQSLTATVSDFITDTGVYDGSQTLTGGAAGGPVASGGTLTLTDTTGFNDDLESFTYGNTLSFNVDLTGAALTSPNGSGSSPYQFIFSTYSDTAGTIPVLTSDPNGVSGIININPPNGAVTTSAVSSKLGIVATPEPSTLWMLCCALAIFGGVHYKRRGLQSASRH
jgi:hypothetical protein